MSTINGTKNNDILSGTAGNDLIKAFEGDDTLNGSAGSDTLDGGAGTDTANYSGLSAGIAVNLWTDKVAKFQGGIDTLISIERIVGSDYADTMTGTGANDDFTGNLGNDILDGGDGVDNADYSNTNGAVQVDLQTGTVTGAAGSDTLVSIESVKGSAFDDTLLGSSADNIFVGEGGNFLRGAGGNDLIDGRDGFDEVDYRDDPGPVTVNLATHQAIDGRGGNDTLLSIEYVSGSRFGDTLSGSDNTQTEVFRGGAGNDQIDGKGGTDLVDYSDSPAGVNVNLATGRVSNDGFGDVDSLINIEDVRGSRNFGDIIVGDVGDNVLQGLGGDDTLDGGAGLDTASYETSPSGVAVTLNGSAAGSASDGWGGTDVLSNIEVVRGSSFDDTLIGSDAAAFESFEGGSGNDRIDGKGGIDRADYHRATSGVIANLHDKLASDDGAGGIDSLLHIEDLRGSEFNDDLTGDDGDNHIEALGGDDSLTGGGGNDTLDGGAGVDTAFFNGPSANYKVTSNGHGGFTVEDMVGNDGVDSLINIENFAFVVQGKLDGSAIVGAAGADDIVSYKGAPSAVTIDLTNGTVSSASGSNTLQFIDGVIGSDFDDMLIGNQANNNTGGSVRMAGGKGSDTYVVYNPGDLVEETDNIGTTPGTGQPQPLDLGSNIDKVITSINYTLTNFVEILALSADGGNLSGTGNALDNQLTGNDANNSFSGKGGNDELDGKGGVDTAVFSGARANYSLNKTASGFTVKDNAGTEGTDTLTHIERTQFSDMGLALDLDGAAGITAKILGAVFGKESISNQEYAGIGLKLLDSGMYYGALMQLALDVRLGFGASNADVVTLLYTNIVGSAPGAAEMALYKGMLDDGSFTHASIGIFAAETPLNAQNVDLVGLSANGLGFI